MEERKEGELENVGSTDINSRYLNHPLSDVRIFRKLKWDIDSPRFKIAQMKLGYDDDDVIKKDMSYFQKDLDDTYFDKKIVKFRY